MLSIIQKVCENYSTGEYTLESVCQNAGVPYRTFKHWWSMYDKEGSNNGSRWAILAEVAGLWEQAQQMHKKQNNIVLIEKAETLLMKVVSGYEYEQTVTAYKRAYDASGNDTFISIGHRIYKKIRQPSLSAIMFVLSKLKPEVYGDPQSVIKEKPEKEKSKYDDMTLQELNAELEKAKQELEICKTREEYEDDYLI